MSVQLAKSGISHDERTERRKQNYRLNVTGMERCLGRLLNAYHHLQRQERSMGLKALEAGLALAERFNASPLTLLHPHVVGRLLQEAIRSDQSLAAAITRLSRGVPAPPQGDTEPARSHALRIRTLGSLQLFVHGEPLTFQRKTPKKPLELLQVLIAFGGRGVHRERLIEAVWPDLDGDLATHAFKTTLYRLRKLVGARCLCYRDGVLSLDADEAWLDVWELEHLCRALQLSMTEGPLPSSQWDAAEQALTLCRGRFLESSADPYWVLAPRERWHALLIKLIKRYADALREHAHHDRAAALYRRGIETDPLCEGFYQGLMRCHLALGRRAEGLAIYAQCLQNLQRLLHTTPCAHTENLRQALLHA